MWLGDRHQVELIADRTILAGLIGRFDVEGRGGSPLADHKNVGLALVELDHGKAGSVIEGAEQAPAALEFISYLLSDEGQEYFTVNTFEYPVVAGIAPPEGLPPIDEIGHPEIDLGDLADLQGTLELLAEVGLI